MSSKQLKIAFIDDEFFLVESLKARYSRTEVVVECFTTLVQIESYSSLVEFDLFVCDYEIDGKRGPTLIEFLRNIGVQQRIIFFSGYGSDPQITSECKAAGASDFIDKAHLDRLDQFIQLEIANNSQ